MRRTSKKTIAPEALVCVATERSHFNWIWKARRKIIDFFYRPKSNLIRHAERELELSGLLKKDSDYNGMIGKEVLRLIKAFANKGHSGMSAAFTIDVFQRLARFENLTPITNDPNDWAKVEGGFWQCKRNPYLFSKNGGKTYYHLDNRKKIIKSERARE